MAGESEAASIGVSERPGDPIAAGSASLPCSRCGLEPRAPNQRWCARCKRAAERQRRTTLRALGHVKPADLGRLLILAMPEPDRSVLAKYLGRHPATLDGVRHVLRAGIERLRAQGFA